MPIMQLNELEPKQVGKILKVRGFGPLRQRMMDMGMVPGAEIKVVRVAPLGDPIEYQIKGYRLSLRHHEARHIIVDVEVLTLDQLQSETTARLLDVNGGYQLKHRLHEMNLKLKTNFVVLKNHGEGPIQIKVGEKEFSIGRGMAKKILAQPTHGEKA
jgi:ferrous iron transport protein A